MPLCLPYWQSFIPPDAVGSRTAYLSDDAQSWAIALPSASEPRELWAFNTFIKDVSLVVKKSGTNGRSNAGTVTQGKTTSWVNVTLTEEHVADLEGNPWSGDEIIDGICSLVALGASITVKPNGGSSGFACFCVIPGGTDDGSNVGLTGYGNSPDDATRSFLYKYYIVCGGKLKASPVTKSRYG